VSPEHHAKLFMPFFTTKPEGVGLGLSLSHSIMEAHGGTLSYRDREGGGAIFEVCMPVLHAPTSVAKDRQ
jgi:signal transduction histidine kinase